MTFLAVGGRRVSSNVLQRSAIEMHKFDASVYTQPICVANGPVVGRERCGIYPAVGTYIPFTVGFARAPAYHTSIHPELNMPLLGHFSTLLTTTFSIRFGCLVNSVGLSKVAARRGGVSAAGMTGTGRRAVGMGPSVWRGTSGTLNVSPKSRLNLLP